MSGPGSAPSAEPVRPRGGGGPPTGLVAAGLLALLVGAVVVAQLWPKGRNLIANGPTESASARASTGLSPTPSSTTEPLSQPPSSAVQPSPSPEVEPALPPLPNLPVAEWSAQVERRVPIPQAFERAVMAVWGPRVYLLDPDGRLLVADLEAETSRTVILPLRPEEGAVSIAVDGDLVAVVAVRQRGSDPLCHAADATMSWRVLTAYLDATGLPSRTFAPLVSGTARRDFTYPLGPPCTGPWAPLAAVAGKQVSVALEAPTNVRAWASTIAIYDLGTAGAAGSARASGAVGASGAAGPTARAVGSLAVSGVVVSLSAVPSLTTWVATTGDPPDKDGDQPAPIWSLGYALGGSTVASTVEAAGPGQGWLPLPSAAADDGIIWWSAIPGYAGLGQIDPGAIEETFVAGDAPGSTVPAEGLSAFDCRLLGAGLGRALATCRDPSDPTGQVYVPVVAGGGQTFQVVDGSIFDPHVGQGWLVWRDLQKAETGVDILTGLPVGGVGPSGP